MNNKLYKYLGVALIMLFSSCTDWLNETNPNMTDGDSYWRNLSETSSTLTSSYAALVNSFALNVAEEAQRSDCATPGFGRPTYSGDGAVWYNHTYTSSFTYIVKKWEALYLGIYRANQTITALENLTDISDQVEWDNQMAQARFLRGLYHFYLHTTFNKGNIIIKDKVAGTQDEMYSSLSKSEDVMAFFREDLQYAYEHLPIAYPEAKDKGRATKGAAATILGTSYLYEATLADPKNPDAEKIKMAKEKFEEVLTFGYRLVEDLSLLYTTAGQMNEESILEVAFSNEMNSEYNTWSEDRLSNRLAFSFDGRGSNQTNVFPSCWITWAYLNEQLDPLISTNYLVDEDDPSVRTIKPVSKRASAMIALIQDEHTEYYQGLVHDKTQFNAQNGFSRYKHYCNHDILEDEKDLPGGKQHSGKNVTLNRLGDLKLMLAECYIYENNVSEALKQINDVRKRWNLVLTGPNGGDVSRTYDELVYSKESLLERLQQIEKPLETSVEGYSIRWNDLRRWGMLESNFKKRYQETYWGADHVLQSGDSKNITTLTAIDPQNDNYPVYKDYQLAASNFRYDTHAWLPIPSTEILTNPGLNE